MQRECCRLGGMPTPSRSKRAIEAHGPTAALVKPASDEPIPSSANPVRRRCKNCPRMFLAIRPDHVFCKPSCRFQFHKLNNTAFGTVKHLFDKHLRAHLKEFQMLEERVLLLETRFTPMLLERIGDLEDWQRWMQANARAR